jgi:hypothetical protein
MGAGYAATSGWIPPAESARICTGSRRQPVRICQSPQPRLADKPGRDYLESMSEQTIQLLGAFDALPSDDKQAFVSEIMRRAREWPFDYGAIDDEEIGEAGKAVFALLDQEENAAHTR